MRKSIRIKKKQTNCPEALSKPTDKQNFASSNEAKPAGGEKTCVSLYVLVHVLVDVATAEQLSVNQSFRVIVFLDSFLFTLIFSVSCNSTVFLGNN